MDPMAATGAVVDSHLLQRLMTWVPRQTQIAMTGVGDYDEPNEHFGLSEPHQVKN